MKIDSAREGYRSAAVRASVAYFVLDDLSRVDPMYQVSKLVQICTASGSVRHSPTPRVAECIEGFIGRILQLA